MRWFQIDQCVHDLTNQFVGGFNDGICSWSVRCDVDRFDSCAVNAKLKRMSLKFWTIVRNNFGRARVSREPVVLKKLESIFSCFGTSQSDDFNEISDRINAGQGVKCHFLIVDFDFPRSNEINMNF